MKRNSLILAIMTLLPMVAVTAANAAAAGTQNQTSAGSDSTKLANIRTLVNWTATSVVSKLVTNTDPTVSNGGWSNKNLRNPPASDSCNPGEISFQSTKTLYVQLENIPYYSRHHKTCCSSPAVCGACVSGGNPDWAPTVAPSAESNTYPWRTWMWLDRCDGSVIPASATSVASYGANVRGFNPNNPNVNLPQCNENPTEIGKFNMARHMGCGSGSCSLTDTLDSNNPYWFKYSSSSGSNPFQFVLNRTCYTVTWAPTS